jgi:hypothetical protein
MAFAGRRCEVFQTGDLACGESDSVGDAVLLEPVDMLRPRNRRDVVSLCEQPGQSDLCGRGLDFIGDLAYLVDDA